MQKYTRNKEIMIIHLFLHKKVHVYTFCPPLQFVLILTYMKGEVGKWKVYQKMGQSFILFHSTEEINVCDSCEICLGE